MKHIILTVTNDLRYDRRMIRICNSLAADGYAVKLVGARKRSSPPLLPCSFSQTRLRVFFGKGPGFYIEYNFRLFLYTLFVKADCFCAIDLDTIIPVYWSSLLRNKKRVYDAHEYFSQQKEIISRPRIYRVWHWIEKTFVPRFKMGYTVSQSITDEFKKLYGVDYGTVRNVPPYRSYLPAQKTEKYVLYQGAVNEARGLEALIPAMQSVDAKLLIYGDGNFMAQTRALISEHDLQDKVILKGAVPPEELEQVTAAAYMGVNLVEHNGLNQYYSLANKFFDYMQHGVPQVTMNFPEYAAINGQYEVAVLVDDTEANAVAASINLLLRDRAMYERLQSNCINAAKELNWENEEKKLLSIYKNILE